MIPSKKDVAPILAGAGIFVFCTYAAIHQFIFPRSEAEAAMIATNRRIDAVETAQATDRKEYLEAIREIRQYIINHK